MNLKEGTSLQGGRYRIERMLGQGGFGITYLGVQMGLNRKVAIKEFYMKEYCERDKDTSHVSLGTSGSRETVERFRQKFVKEAQTISALSHPNIVRIYDVFEENGTAYYVMEYHGNGSLSELVKSNGRLDEQEAIGYIHQIAEALRYIHERNINHLDIKPSNVLIDNKGVLVLIDFGMSKRYDKEGNQTSTTPIGISHGYAPMEQYNVDGVNTFSPQVDIYSLGATLYKLVTGQTPPQANVVFNDGLPILPSFLSASVVCAITEAMRPARKDRPCNVDELLSILDTPIVVMMEDNEKTEVEEKNNRKSATFPASSVSVDSHTSSNRWWIVLLICLLSIWGIWRTIDYWDGREDKGNIQTSDTYLNQSEGGEQPVISDEVLRLQKAVNTTFYVTTSPNGANVYVDGEYVGKTPIRNKEFSIGNHVVKIILDGYKAFSKECSFNETPFIINETLETVDVSLRTTPQQEIAPSKSVTNVTVYDRKYVDLGLSVKWADCNVGASSPKEDGCYVKWNNISLKSVNALEKEQYKWRGSWRLPTKTEFAELLNKCKWTWNSQGYYTVVGPNGNRICLPASGIRNGKMLNDVNEGGYYWCSSPYEGSSQDAYFFYFYSDDRSVTWGNINVERSVRLVLE